MVKKISVLVTILFASFLFGCGSLTKPRTSVTLASGGMGQYKAGDFKKDYDTYKRFATGDTADINKAKTQRDLMINLIELDVDLGYGEFERKLFVDRASYDTAADVLELGVTASTNIVNGTRVKNVLAAALTGFKGSRLSFDKNFFREKTVDIIITKMRASREESRASIAGKMKLPVDQYPFEEAWRDLADFFKAGTLQGGIQALAMEAGTSAKTADTNKKEVDKARVMQFLNSK